MANYYQQGKLNKFLQKQDFDTLSVKSNESKSNYHPFKTTNYKKPKQQQQQQLPIQTTHSVDNIKKLNQSNTPLQVVKKYRGFKAQNIERVNQNMSETYVSTYGHDYNQQKNSIKHFVPVSEIKQLQKLDPELGSIKDKIILNPPSRGKANKYFIKIIKKGEKTNQQAHQYLTHLKNQQEQLEKQLSYSTRNEKYNNNQQQDLTESQIQELNNNNQTKAIDNNSLECNEPIDEELYDSVSINDQKLNEVLALAHSSSKDIETLLEDNSDYIRHIFGYCECYNCKCGTCKCKFVNNNSPFKINYKNGLASTYCKEYKPYQFNSFDGKINDLYLQQQQAYETNLSRQPLNTEYQTINQNNFKHHPYYTINSRFFPKEKIKQSPLYCISTYQNEFPSWNNNNKMRSPDQRFPERVQALKDQDFCKTTTYKNFFNSQKPPNKLKDLDPLPHKVPLSQYLPFLGTTESKFNYQPITKNYPLTKSPLIQGTSQIEGKAYPGNYLTVTMQKQKLGNQQCCPAKVLDKVPFEKIKQKILNSFKNFINSKN